MQTRITPVGARIPLKLSILVRPELGHRNLPDQPAEVSQFGRTVTAHLRPACRQQHCSPAYQSVPSATSVRPARQYLASMAWSFAFRVSGNIIVSLWCIEGRVAHFFAVPFLATPAFAIGVDQAGIGATAARVIQHRSRVISWVPGEIWMRLQANQGTSL